MVAEVILHENNSINHRGFCSLCKKRFMLKQQNRVAAKQSQSLYISSPTISELRSYESTYRFRRVECSSSACFRYKKKCPLRQLYGSAPAWVFPSSDQRWPVVIRPLHPSSSRSASFPRSTVLWHRLHRGCFSLLLFC